jgi:hypothetical protein
MEDNKEELCWRRKAIRLMLRGLRPCDILKRVPRGREWLRKWSKRFTQLGWLGLQELSRRPATSPQGYSAQAHTVVIRVRAALERRRVGLLGAHAVRQEIIRQRLLRTVPSLTTTKRWLKKAGLTHTDPPQPVKVYCPQPDWMPDLVLHAMDWLARYLEGGEKLFVFHSVDAQTRALAQTISRDKTVATVRRHLLETWQELGLPHRLQLDNDAAFNGGERTPRRFGTVVRLCLYFGIEPVFLPPGEPKRNSLVERINGLWVSQFWERNHFSCAKEVVGKQGLFLHWYADQYEPPPLEGLTPAQMQRRVRRVRLLRQQIRALPAELPITAGRVHFVRKVSCDGRISFLGESWKVGRRLAHQYVWATVITHCRRLQIYHQRSETARWRLIKIFNYELAETICRLRLEFKR